MLHFSSNPNINNFSRIKPIKNLIKGHVFRKSTPYSFPGGTSLIVNKNNARLVEVWLDEWKEFYYNINPGNLLL
jgi:hypothetical protein